MSQARILAIAFIVVGAGLVLVSVLADVVFGSRGTTFGWKQLLGVVLGIVIAAAGVVLLRQGDAEYEDDEEYDEDEDGETEGHAEGAVTQANVTEKPAAERRA